MSRQGIRIAASARGSTFARAFTLIEILVVVAIIALLISILLPSLSRARAQAKNVACRANLHDLGQTFLIYADQSKNFFPANHDPFLDSFQALVPGKMLRNPQILVCPATSNVVKESTIRKPLTAADYAVSSTSVWAEERANTYYPYIPSSHVTRHAGSASDSAGYHSYEYMAAYKRDNTAKWYRRKSIPTFFPPSDMLLVHDEDDQPGGSLAGMAGVGCSGSTSSMASPAQPGNNCPQPWDNHKAEGMNMMFADGHAQFTKKVGGLYKDYSKTPPVTRQNENASIDRIWDKASSPYLIAGQ